MAEAPPRVYLFYGDDELAITEAISQLRSNLGDPSTADLNVTRFSGSGLNLGALEENSRSAPFLAPRRLVILTEAGQAVSDKPAQERFAQLLESLPETTALILVQPAAFKSPREEVNWQKSSPLYQWTQANPNSSYVRAFLRPTGPSFVRWIADRCRSLGGEIELQAAHLLAELVSEDMHLADRELEKLLDYVNRARPIMAEDVELLTPYHGQTNVFAMVDAIGQRQGRKAMALMRELLQEEDPGYAFAMIVRQFRLILQAQEAQAAGLPVEKALHIHPFVAGKVAAQARNFDLEQLKAAYRRLMQIDLSAKTGMASLEVELDRFLADLAR